MGRARHRDPPRCGRRARARRRGLRPAEHRAPGDPRPGLRHLPQPLRPDVGRIVGRPDDDAVPDAARPAGRRRVARRRRGWGLQVVMAALFGVSILVWTRTALAFGARAALVTAVALLVYPGYGILFHTPRARPSWQLPSHSGDWRSRERGCSRRRVALRWSAWPRRPPRSRGPGSRSSPSSLSCPWRFARRGGRASRAPRRTRRSSWPSSARGRSRTEFATTTTRWRVAAARSSRSIGRSRPTTSSRPRTGPRPASWRRSSSEISWTRSRTGRTRSISTTSSSGAVPASSRTSSG